MKINCINNYNPNFKAKFIKNTTILKKDNNGEYKNTKVSIAEIDFKNYRDIRSLRNITNNWSNEYEKKYTYGMDYSTIIQNYVEMEKGYRENHCNGTVNNQFFIMTNQNSDFDNLRPQNALALAQIRTIDDSFVKLEYLQVNPKYKFEPNKERQIKHIGTNFLHDLTEIIPKPVELFSNNVAKPFYIKTGYKEDSFNKFTL